MVSLRPADDCGIDEIRVRVPGGAVFPPGSTVQLHAAGSAPTWPAPSR